MEISVCLNQNLIISISTCDDYFVDENFGRAFPSNALSLPIDTDCFANRDEYNFTFVLMDETVLCMGLNFRSFLVLIQGQGGKKRERKRGRKREKLNELPSIHPILTVSFVILLHVKLKPVCARVLTVFEWIPPLPLSFSFSPPVSLLLAVLQYT